jgi:glycosyltransferase involved in cell wall biosynthesis
MIPAFNEEKTISKVIKEIPRRIEGISSVKVLVVNDGSTDNTVKAALKAGAGKVVSHKQNFGLAAAFRTGLQESLMLGADVIVNTDADFQYDQKEIPKLIRPILDGKADLVLTFRNVWGLSHMPLLKKIGNSISTFVASFAAGIPVKDAQSGFRAFSKEAALRLNVLSNYTYVQETIIQAASKNLAIMQLPCKFRKREGKSRLVSSIPKYARNVFLIMLRNYVYYRPLKFFLEIGGIFFLAGLLFVF